MWVYRAMVIWGVEREIVVEVEFLDIYARIGVEKISSRWQDYTPLTLCWCLELVFRIQAAILDSFGSFFWCLQLRIYTDANWMYIFISTF